VILISSICPRQWEENDKIGGTLVCHWWEWNREGRDLSRDLMWFLGRKCSCVKNVLQTKLLVELNKSNHTLLHSVQASSETQPASCPKGSFLRNKDGLL
jgi:hypothetical protein